MILRPPQALSQGNAYALFVPLVDTEEGLSLVYEKRAKKMRRQPGEICFPGGKIDPGENIQQAALRELEEELGVTPLEVYGRTDFLQLRNSDMIYPVLGKITPNYTINQDEVERVFSVPVAQLKTQVEEASIKLSPSPLFPKEQIGRTEEYPFSSAIESFSIYRWKGDIIWGMTGRITKSILSYL